MGLEPTTSSSTDWRSNHLSYTHHVEGLRGLKAGENMPKPWCFVKVCGRRTEGGAKRMSQE